MQNEAIIHLEESSVYLDKQAVLSDLNLDINKGEFVYIIGKSGAGKTSLLRSLYADLPVKEGIATVCGISLTKISRKNISALRRKLGVVLQHTKLLGDSTVYGNLHLALRATGWRNKKQIHDRIIEVLEAVSMSDKISRPVYKLSEGEQQRVGIARALLNHPEIILADEPTGDLDPITSEEIMQLLKRLNQENGTTVVVSSHDYIMLEKFPARMICCESGTII